MNIDRPKLAIGTFSTTLAAAFFGMMMLPSSRVNIAYKAAWLGSGYLSVDAWDMRKNRHDQVKILSVRDKTGRALPFKKVGPRLWRVNTGNARKVSLVTVVRGHKRLLHIHADRKPMPAVVETPGPFAFRCKDMGFLVVPLEGVPVLGLDNPFLVMPRQESGALSPVLPARLRLVFESSGKSVTLNLNHRRTQVVSMPVQPTRPLIFKVMLGSEQLCRYSYFLEGRAKGIVMNDATLLLQGTQQVVFHARLNIIEPPMHLYCFAYQRQDVHLTGPVAYKSVDMDAPQARLYMRLPSKPGLYYVLCTPDPVTPLFYYVRRDVLVAGKYPAKQVIDAMDHYDIAKIDRHTILSLVKSGRIKAAVGCLSAQMPDLLPPVDVAVSTLKTDQKQRRERHEKAASTLLVLVGIAFAGITLWLVLVSLESHRGLRQALEDEGAPPSRAQWPELALFVLINLANLAVLVYTLALVFF